MTPSLAEALADIARQLRGLGRPFALAGGMAVTIQSEVRFTRDVDLVIAVSNDEEVEGLVRALRPHGYGVQALVEHSERKSCP